MLPVNTKQAVAESAANNPNRMQAWFPSVEETEGLLYPQTRMLDFPIDLQLRLLSVLEGGETMPASLMRELDRVAMQVASAVIAFGGVAFLRTGTTSMKHSWRHTCFISDASLETARRHVCAMLHEGMSAFAPVSDVLVVREMIPTTPIFHAFEGMPITREFRFFVDGEGVLGFQFYWPEDAFEHQEASLPASWRDDLHLRSRMSASENRFLGEQARCVAEKLGGSWSADFLEGKDGNWYLIDMAKMEDSYISKGAHWTPYGKKRLGKA